MKRICLAVLSLMIISLSGISATDLTVDFENGIPAGWQTAGSATVKKDNGSNRLALGGNATLTSPAIKGLKSVSYKHRGSGNNKELIVEASQDNGNSWTQIGSTKVSSASSYGSAGHTLTFGPSAEAMVRFTCMSATIYIDDIVLTAVESADAPTRQASLTVSEITGSSAAMSITPGDGSGRLVAYTPGDKLDWTPYNGESFTGSFPKKQGDIIIAASDDISEITLTGLEPGSVYTAAVFEYNGNGDSRAYLTADATPVTFTTLTVPVVTPSVSVLDFMNTKTGVAKEKNITLRGIYLTPSDGKITLTIPAGAFSFAGGTGKTEIAYTDGTLTATVTVRFTPHDFARYEDDMDIEYCGTHTTVRLTGNGAESDSNEYFIAPDGNDDSGDGSIGAPWMNLQKAVDAAAPGDIIYCRGGRYHFTRRDSSGKLTVRIKTSGTAEAPITIRSYQDEAPIFDFEQQLLDCKRDRSKVGDRGILLTGNYWHLYGLHITHAADNGIKLEGSHNRIERCEFSYNLDTGLQLGFGHNFSDAGFGVSKNDGSYCAYNDIIDCDSHHNCDYDANYGSDADGFACKMHNGKGNRFIRCRAWRNSDDAWDLYETDYSVMLYECWAWHSGKAEDHEWVMEYFDKGPSFSGNGNGIKLGGNGTGGSSQGVHYAYNCVAFGCDKSGSTKGFDCNSHKGGHVVVGGLAFDNGYDFMFESGGGANSEFYNNVCFGRQEILVGTESHNALGITPNQGKTFYNNVVTGFSRSDYESLEEADALAPRGEDGSLPVKFARLKSGSRLVDAGTFREMIGADDLEFLKQPVYGAKRDIGPYELAEGPISSIAQVIMTADKSQLFELSRSGRGEVLARLRVSAPCSVSLSVYTVGGALLTVIPLGNLEPGADYTFPISTDNLQPGIYLVSSGLGGAAGVRKLVVK